MWKIIISKLGDESYPTNHHETQGKQREHTPSTCSSLDDIIKKKIRQNLNTDNGVVSRY